MTYGGAPGAYGPAEDSGPSSFGDWAATVDLLPVPIDYKLAAVGDIIPKEWITPFNVSVSYISYIFKFLFSFFDSLYLWAQAEILYYNQLGAYPYLARGRYYVRVYFSCHSTFNRAQTQLSMISSDSSDVISSILMCIFFSNII